MRETSRHRLILNVAVNFIVTRTVFMVVLALFWAILDPFWAAAPKGPMTYAFTQEKILLLLLLRPPPLRPKFKPRGPNSSFEAQILASRPKF